MASITEEYALPLSTISTICFDTIYNVNSIYTDRQFAEWANLASIYDVAIGNIDMPPVIYTVLMYSEDAPQVVAAYYQHEHGIQMTKTPLVYNPLVVSEALYAAFPYIAMSIWHDMDSMIIDLRQESAL